MCHRTSELFLWLALWITLAPGFGCQRTKVGASRSTSQPTRPIPVRSSPAELKALEIDRLYALPDARHLLFQGRSYNPALPPPWGDPKAMPRALRDMWKTTRVYVVDFVSSKVGLVPISFGANAPEEAPVQDVSADGKRIALYFALTPPWYSQEAVYDLVASRLAKIPVQSRSGYGSARFSPDGHRLAVTRFDMGLLERRGRERLGGGLQGLEAVWVTDLEAPKWMEVAPRRSLFDWTSDGARLVVYRYEYDYATSRWRGDLSVIAVSPPRRERPLTHTYDVAGAEVNHARHLIVYVRSWPGPLSPRELWVMRENGSRARRLTSLSGYRNFGGNISPDGTRFAYVDGDLLWVVDIDSGKGVKVTPKPGVYRLPVWVADGSALAFIEGYDDYEHGERILLGDPAGKKPPHLLVGKPGLNK